MIFLYDKKETNALYGEHDFIYYIKQVWDYSERQKLLRQKLDEK
jgi:hypothetical protein